MKMKITLTRAPYEENYRVTSLVNLVEPEIGSILNDKEVRALVLEAATDDNLTVVINYKR